MSQIHNFRRAPRRYAVNDIPALPLLAYENFESSSLGDIALYDGWAAAGLIYTYAGEIGYENFETSTLTNNSAPDHGWNGDGVLFFTVSVPTTVVAPLGGTTTLTVTPSGAAGFTYQWSKNGVVMTNTGAYSGVTTQTLTITGTVSGDYTTFTCAVTCLGTAVTSSAITLVTVGTDWSTRVVTNGGAAPAGATVTAIDTFCAGLVTDGIFTKMNAVNVFAPDNLTACRTPLIRGATGFDPWTNNNFVGGDLSVDGLVGNASNKTLNSGVNPTTFPMSSGFSWYAKTVTATGYSMGCYDGTHNFIGAAKYTDNKTYGWNSGSSGSNVSVTSPGAGFYSDIRVSSTDHRIYFANSGSAHAQIGATDTTAATGSYLSQPIFVFCVNLTSGTVQLPTSDKMSFVAIHSGMTGADSANLYSRVQTLRTSFGGGYV